MSHPWLVQEQDRCNYGLQWQQVIATNQAPNVVLGPPNFHYPPEKNVFAVQGEQDQQYIQDFETNIRSPIKDFLVSELSDCTWTLNILRLGFENNRCDNPVVMHLFIQKSDYFFDHGNNAIKVLEGMEWVIPQNTKSPEKYFIDICQIYSSTLRSSGLQSNRGVDLTHNFEKIYEEYTPLPGLSIGREEYSAAGSLTGFLRHNDDIYSLTCRHVAFPDKNFRTGYKYQNGKEKLQVSIPAMKDHAETKSKLKFALDNIEFETNNVRFEDAASIDEEYMLCIERQEMRRKLTLARYNAAEDYYPNAGYVSAAPEAWRKVSGYTGNLDWAIIHNVCLPRTRFVEEAQISSLIQSKQKEHQWSNDECQAFNSKCQALQDSQEFNIKHPSSSSALGTNKFYFKAPSRTLGWLACELNSIRNIHHENGHGESEECVFVGALHGGAASGGGDSGGGDSGALIYDIDIDTTNSERHAAALIPMAMIWGGNHHGSVVSGFGDVTYATPIGAVLKDIESEMGWDEGSLKFC
ncbi:uncharacterized protein Bfra_005740ca [Botrytis fragariae]|uniref:Uncharacterized protein n=1 Tax=Botrytis fragariae TaxID=1964551 RepID=A0A8H6ARD4_9HELO|nr:uncharacterized protein Bfra_005740ca [Botrytis fragariae]KAF5872381.1 hypothetical protein Bfra_005740ca [Botrytis fragariae]